MGPRHQEAERLTPIILDIGSGGNPEFPATFKRPSAICIDKRPSEGALLADVEERLPFEDGSVSKVYLYDVIEHLDAPGKALKEILRVLSPGGELELGTPNALWLPKVVRFALRGRYAGHKDHVQTYGPPELRSRLERSGFKDIKVEVVTYRDDERPLWSWLLTTVSPFPSLNGRQLRARAVKP